MVQRRSPGAGLRLGSASGLLLALLAGELVGARGSAPFKELNVSTPLGYLTVWQYGDEGADRVALALHGGVLKDLLMYEWEFVARRLAEFGKYKVLVPSFYSNPRLEPGRLQFEASGRLLESLKKKLANDKPFELLMGKSWGGALAARLAAFKPELMRRLVLVAPGGLSELHKSIGCRTLLFWAKDDRVTLFSKVRRIRQLLRNEVAFYAPASGGHAIRRDYADAILAFATDAAELPDLDGSKVLQRKDQKGAHPEDEVPEPAEDEDEGLRTGVIVGIWLVGLVLVCGSIALCVCCFAEFWEGKGKYMVKHLKPPKPTVVGAEDEDEDVPWE